MTQNDRDRLERARFTILAAARASGVVLMLIGIWIWNGSILREGGWPAVGVPLFLLGAGESLLLPTLLVRRWRSPRQP